MTEEIFPMQRSVDNHLSEGTQTRPKAKAKEYHVYSNVLAKYGLKDFTVEPLDRARVKSLWLDHFKRLLASIGIKAMSFQESYDPDIVQQILGLNYYELQELHTQSENITVVLDPDRFFDESSEVAHVRDVPGKLKSLFSEATLNHPKLGKYLTQAKTWEDLRAVAVTVYEIMYIYYHSVSVLKPKIIPPEYEGMFIGHMTLFEFMMRLESICEVSYFNDFGGILTQIVNQSRLGPTSVEPNEAYRKAEESLALLKFMEKVYDDNKDSFLDYIRYCHLKYVQGLTSTVNWEQDPEFDLRRKLDLKAEHSVTSAVTTAKTQKMLREYSSKFERVEISNATLNKMDSAPRRFSKKIVQGKSTKQGGRRFYNTKSTTTSEDSEDPKPSKNDLRYIRRKFIKDLPLTEREKKLARLYGLLDENSLEYKQAKVHLEKTEKDGGLHKVLCLDEVSPGMLTEPYAEELWIPIRKVNIDHAAVTTTAVLSLQTLGHELFQTEKMVAETQIRTAALYKLQATEDQWVLFDCGASNHFVGDIAQYRQVTRISDPEKQLRVSYNGTVVCDHVGSVVVGHILGHEIIIDNVWYIAGLKEMIVSANELRDNDHRFEVISDSSGLRVHYIPLRNLSKDPFQVRKIRNLEYLNFNKLQNTTTTGALASISETSILGKFIESLHYRLGHVSYGALLSSIRNDSVTLPNGVKKESLTGFRTQDLRCTWCDQGKSKRRPYGSSSRTYTSVGELIHSDLSGELPLSSSGYKYILTFIDEYSKYMWSIPLSRKSQVQEEFVVFRQYLKTQLGKEVKILRSDNGGEYSSHQFELFLRQCGIIHETTVPYAHQQNGVSERRFSHLWGLMRTINAQSRTPISLWDFLMSYVTKLINSMYIRRVKDGRLLSSFQILFGRKPDVSEFHVFGADCTIHIPVEKRAPGSKLSPTGSKAFYLGPIPGTEGAYLYNMDTNRVEQSYSFICSDAVTVTFNNVKSYTHLKKTQADTGRPQSSKPQTGNSPYSIDSEVTVNPKETPVSGVSPVHYSTTETFSSLVNPIGSTAYPTNSVLSVKGQKTNSECVTSLTEHAPQPVLNSVDTSSEVPNVTVPTVNIDSNLAEKQSDTGEKLIETPEVTTDVHSQTQDAIREGSDDSDESEDYVPRNNASELDTSEPESNEVSDDELEPSLEELKRLDKSVENVLSRSNPKEEVGKILKSVYEKKVPTGPTPPIQEVIQVPSVRRSGRRGTHQREGYYKDLADGKLTFVAKLMREDVEIPQSVEKALSSKYADEWVTAMESEVKSLIRNKTWENAVQPNHSVPISSKWVFSVKTNSLEEVTRFKARLVARGFTQKLGVDYDWTFSPVVGIEHIRMMFALAAEHNMFIHQIDIKTAFLNADLDKELFMRIPLGNGKQKVVRLLKSIYGLKQSPLLWYKTLEEELFALHFQKCESDGNIYLKGDSELKVILLVYVDDILIFSKNKSLINKVVDKLGKRFEITNLGGVNKFLGMRVTQSEDGGKVNMDASEYVDRFVHELVLDGVRNVSSPMAANTELLDQDDSPLLSTERKNLYLRIIGCLRYLCTIIRYDIAFSVRRLSHFMCQPRETHLQLLYKVVGYVKSTKDFQLSYEKNGGPLRAYSDASFRTEDSSLYSISGSLVILGGAPIVWKSKRQTVLTTSTMDAELVALDLTHKLILDGRLLLSEVGYRVDKPVCVYEDNMPLISRFDNRRNYTGSRNLCGMFNNLLQSVEQEQVKLIFVGTKNQLADMLTKALAKTTFERIMKRIENHNTTDQEEEC